jgi:hypothetical protein
MDRTVVDSVDVRIHLDTDLGGDPDDVEAGQK